MSIKRPILLLIITAVLSACHSTSSLNVGQASQRTALLNDELFPKSSLVYVETQDEIFALSDEMKQLVYEKLSPKRDLEKRANELLKQLFDAGNVEIAYKNSANLTASQAFKNRTANCMSLTIMAYALAKEAKLNVSFQNVDIPEYWVRNGKYNMLTGHVNILVSPHPLPQVDVLWGATVMEIDFDPTINKRNFPTQTIKKNTVVSMFYNNKGADALISKDYSTAYKYFKAAIDVDPVYPASWGNLGILYRYINQPEYAERAYRHAVSLDDNNLNALTNLAILLHSKGEYEQAKKIDLAILKQRVRNPFYHALLGNEAFYDGDIDSSVKHYQKAINLDKNVHEFYFGLAKAYTQLGKYKSAENAMKKAIMINRAPSIDTQYVAKLDILKRYVN